MFIASMFECGGLHSSMALESRIVLSVWAALEHGVVHLSVTLFQILDFSERSMLEHGVTCSSMGLKI